MAAIKKLLPLFAALMLAGSAHSQLRPQTPVKHLVILMLQDQSFDRYFGHYPLAKNLPGENPFQALPGTPKVDGFTSVLLKHNPNLSNPYRMAPGSRPVISGMVSMHKSALTTMGVTTCLSGRILIPAVASMMMAVFPSR
ncbi:alkaline phosphatase family protein [Dongshaea marina]|uniref:hypothetical protein n=1 Tax=Dongshaea marina TaxID=2047966 RepID=UPI000D3E0B14|nr:hypothetical protein [Dongshaea marina]